MFIILLILMVLVLFLLIAVFWEIEIDYKYIKYIKFIENVARILFGISVVILCVFVFSGIFPLSIPFILASVFSWKAIKNFKEKRIEMENNEYLKYCKKREEKEKK
jgi:hypothetical protein